MERADYVIRRYLPADKQLWDDFVSTSRNSTFLFCRDYMDYHADRFTDMSLLAFQGGKLCAMLPADVTPDGVLHSHRGLTYGGWILPQAHVDGADLLHIFEAAADFCRSEGLSAIDYKPLPFIYARRPSQEDLYALFRLGAHISEVNLSSALDLSNPPSFNTLQRRLFRKAEVLTPRLVSSPQEGSWDVAPFWNMLAECLAERHETSPVHSLAELQMLRDRFPANIRIHMVLSPDSNSPSAGVCLFLAGNAVHCQYICTTSEGRNLNLLPYLFHHLIHDTYSPKHHPDTPYRWFDFGTSNEAAGRILNPGLLRQKFSFGATGVSYPRFHLPLPPFAD